MQPLRWVMADDAMTTAWDKAEKAIIKGKGESALKILRDADAGGNEPTTLRLAGHATWVEAKARNNRAEYRRAASLLREATKKNPRDKKADRTYNCLLYTSPSPRDATLSRMPSSA